MVNGELFCSSSYGFKYIDFDDFLQLIIVNFRRTSMLLFIYNSGMPLTTSFKTFYVVYSGGTISLSLFSLWTFSKKRPCLNWYNRMLQNSCLDSICEKRWLNMKLLTMVWAILYLSVQPTGLLHLSLALFYALSKFSRLFYI